MFFSLLPNIEYSQNRTKYRFTDEDFVVAKNIFNTMAFDNSIYNSGLFNQFILKDGVRPDQLAEIYYNDANYDWIILLSNRIINLQNDWPLSSAEFEKMIAKKYDNAFSIKHWVTKEVKNDIGEIVQPKGLIVYYDPSKNDSYTLRYVKSYNPRVEEIQYGDTLLNSVTYYDYELELNEKKKTIQLLKPVYLKTFISLFQLSTGYSLSTDIASISLSLKKTLNVENIFNNKTL